MKIPQLSFRRGDRGFTLVEVLVVLVIISIIMFMAVPNMGGMIKGSKLTQAGDQLRYDLELAQQAANKDSTPMEVRFYKFDDPEQAVTSSGQLYTAYGIYRLLPDLDKPSDPTAPRILDPLIKIKKLPPGIVIPEDPLMCTLISNEKIPTGPEEVRGLIPTVKRTPAVYRAFQFTAEGGTNLEKSGKEQWYLTLIDANEVVKNGGSVNGIIPTNYITLQVDAFNGAIRWFQPQ